MRRSIFGAALGLCAAGCFGPFSVGLLNPRPNVLLPAGTAPGTLVLGPLVPDAFISRNPGLRDLDVRQWHATLHSGFAAGFESSDPGARVLTILGTELSISVAAVNQRGEPIAGTMTLRFQAIVRDAEGREIAIADTVSARTPFFAEAQVLPNVAMAVEAMYERVARAVVSPPTSGMSGEAP